MKYLKASIILILVAGLLLSCQSSGGISQGSGNSEDQPGWVQTRPVDNDYYIGIGISNTGDKAADMETAKAKAKIELASEISSKVKGEFSLVAEEDSSGFSSESAKQVISESVEQNLQKVETVDTYYSPDNGYWFYLRLNKLEWEEIQRKEMETLSNRVKDIIQPVFTDNEQPVTEKLTVLWKGWEVLNESPFKVLVKAEINGKTGALYDLVEKEIVSLVADLTLDLPSSVIEIEVGRTAELNFSIQSGAGLTPGPLPVLFGEKGTNLKSLMEVKTDNDGSYIGEVDFKNLEIGKTRLSVYIDLANIGINEDQMSNKLSFEEKELLVDIQQIKTDLLVSLYGDVFEGLNERGLFGSIKALFSDSLPSIKISQGEGDTTFVLAFDLSFRGMEPSDISPFYFLYETASISILRNNRSIYTYETAEVKGGGLNWAQAHSKSIEKLLEQLSADTDFIDGITGVFSFE